MGNYKRGMTARDSRRELRRRRLRVSAYAGLAALAAATAVVVVMALAALAAATAVVVVMALAR